MTQADQPYRLRTSSATDEADRAVLVRLADGELDALEDLYDRYKTMAYSIAYRITNDSTLAEDVVQDAFLGAWRHAARYVGGRGSVKTWLLAIVHHRAIDAVRRRRPTTELPDIELPPPAVFTLPDVWAEVAAGLDAQTVQGVLGALSDVQREAIELAYFGGLTHQEIADRTATPLGTVKSRMRLGLLAMRRSLEPMDAAKAVEVQVEPVVAGRSGGVHRLRSTSDQEPTSPCPAGRPSSRLSAQPWPADGRCVTWPDR